MIITTVPDMTVYENYYLLPLLIQPESGDLRSSSAGSAMPSATLVAFLSWQPHTQKARSGFRVESLGFQTLWRVQVWAHLGMGAYSRRVSGPPSYDAGPKPP